MRHFFTAFLTLFLLPLPTAGQDLESRVVEHTLKNGMKFLFVERHQAPVFSSRIMVKVGGVDEHTGITGIAHMFEHMAFKGTRHIGTKDYGKEKPVLAQIDRAAVAFTRARANIPPERRADLRALERKLLASEEPSESPDDRTVALLRKEKKRLGDETPGYLDAYIRMKIFQIELKRLQEEHKKHIVRDEFTQILIANGSPGINAGTGKDYTVYVTDLPANRLDLWAMMESERLFDPILREFYMERDVVAEERRMRYETNPDGKLYEALVTTAFQAHPYGLPNIGWMSDISNFSADDARAFYKTYYVPGNMVGVLVGDFHTPDAIKLVEKYFGKYPAGPSPPEILTREPKQEGERRTNIEFDAEPQVLIGFHKPTAPHRDDYVFDLIHGLLTDTGRSSRLYKRLVKKDRIASSVSTAGGPGARYNNIFYFEATPIHPHTTKEIEKAIYEELDRMKTEPVGEKEFQKVVNNLEADFVRGLASNGGLAQKLAYFQTTIGDWRYTVNHAKVIAALTPEDVMRVAKTYFVPVNRTVVTLVKTAKSETPKP
jgi:predicted Zn-dependent peptidase